MTHPEVTAHQSKNYHLGRNYEDHVAAHLRSLGASVTRAHMSSGYDLDVRHADGTVEKVECKGGNKPGGAMQQSARAKEVFAMGALVGPLVIYTNKLPTPGSIADRLVQRGRELGFISAMRLFVV
jgi:hypothetical protein